MQLWYEWDEGLQCNVFTSRVTMEPVYTQMYDEFHDGRGRDGKRRSKYPSQWCVGSDFPMDHFVFYLEEDEKRFVESYGEYLVYDKENPPRAWQRPENPEGFSWCDRCRVFHEKRDPNLPPLEEELADKMAAEIQREIDEEIIAMLMKIK